MKLKFILLLIVVKLISITVYGQALNDSSLFEFKFKKAVNKTKGTHLPINLTVYLQEKDLKKYKLGLK